MIFGTIRNIQHFTQLNFSRLQVNKLALLLGYETKTK
jgi:hypothetical protein